MDVKVPDIGDFSEVPVVAILVSVGDTVSEEDPLIELESDKATMEVPSPAAGKVVEIKVSEGDKVGEGSVILVLEGADAKEEAPKDEAPAAEAPKSVAATGSASAIPVGTSARSPGASTTSTVVCRSAPASPGCA